VFALLCIICFDTVVFIIKHHSTSTERGRGIALYLL